MRTIDHIVYSVPNLEEAVKDLAQKLGIQPTIGGRHTTEGTKNALLNLGNTCYLEILAIDHDNLDITPPRWMGIDNIISPKISRWSLRTNDPQKDSKIVVRYNSGMGKIKGGQRKTPSGKTLTWGLVMPLASPEVELIPFMTDWSKSDVHPTDSMPEICKLIRIQLSHPKPETIEPTLEQLGVEIVVSRGDLPTITAVIDSPNGEIKI